MVDITALFNLSYGIYLLGAHHGKKLGGCLVNTVFQLTAEPIRVGVSVAKANQTHEFIMNSGTVAVTVMDESADTKLLGAFGYRSGRDVEKYADIPYHLDSHNDPLIDAAAVAHLSCKVVQAVDMDTHTLFVCEVTDTYNCDCGKPMTYNYYREVKKGQSSKFAPTYVNPVELARMKKEKETQSNQ